VHPSPAAHTLPHAPQFAESFDTSTHVLPHATVPLGHFTSGVNPTASPGLCVSLVPPSLWIGRSSSGADTAQPIDIDRAATSKET